MTESDREGFNYGKYGGGYSASTEVIREQEYPNLNSMSPSLIPFRSTYTDHHPLRGTETIYLDHAGTTIYAKSLITAFSREMNSSLFGNPHSMSLSSQLSTRRTEEVRTRVLHFFNASPEEFDVVFVANATAAIKLVADSFRDCDSRGFWYGYHVDSHTSVVGVREVAEMGYQCFQDVDVDAWIAELGTAQLKAPRLFAFPAQSNMNGRRLPIRWCEQIRSAANETGNVFTLLDASSFVSTAPLDLGKATDAPDFTALSFYKIFGFPDLGALIVRKSAAHILERRKFFGGGTVDMVIATGTQWHAKKESSIHAQLEDGTLPFHSIIALGAAIDTHRRLYGSMANISAHTGFLAKRVYDRLSAMAHFNDSKVCQIYQSDYANPALQGPIIAFNLRNSRGEWIPKTEVESLATMQNIQLRSGSVCNPGGTAFSLGWTSQELRRHYAAGLRCGDDHDLLDGRPTGIVRVSLGAMTNLEDIDSLIDFIEKFYVEKVPPLVSLTPPLGKDTLFAPHFYVESVTIFPIKGCGAFRVPEGQIWEIKKEGIAWDQEWHLIHAGSGVPMNQWEHPRMALICPSVDVDRNILRITCAAKAANDELSLEIPLTWSRTCMGTMTTPVRSSCQKRPVSAHGDQSCLRAYASPVVSAFFSNYLGVSCTLARFSLQDAGQAMQRPHLGDTWKDRLRRFTRLGLLSSTDQFPGELGQKYLAVSRETAILIISRSSLNLLNENIQVNTKSTSRIGGNFTADVLQGNIVIGERTSQLGRAELPFVEKWSSIYIGHNELRFDTFDPCQRCQTLCVDQATGMRRMEILAALHKKQQIDGKDVLGRYAAISTMGATESEPGRPGRRSIMVGDVVLPSYQHD